MTEPSGRELNDKIADIREWLVRIDTKVDFLNEVKNTADRAEAKADKALLKTDDQAEDLTEFKQDVRKEMDGMRTTTKWAIGLTITSFLGVGSLLIAVFN